ncbi:MAG: DUF4962 domain-containing protein [Planctomycetota bacterium]
MHSTYVVMLLAICACVIGAAEIAEPRPVSPAYAQAHPRLLFDGDFVTVLKDRARQQPDMWKPVLAAATRHIAGVPDEKTIREGKRYDKADALFAAALAYRVVGDVRFRDGAIAWMKAHCQTDVWGVGWRENVDIPANWYMYYIALAYDVLYQDISDADRRIIVSGLGKHAEAVYQSWLHETKIPYDQNHTYVPMVGLSAVALALLGDDPRAATWLTFARGIMDKCRLVLPEDGYYYEGTGYWEYAFHWHVRYADLISRATGEAAFDLPMFRKNHLYAAYLSVPGAPYLFDIGDTGKGTGRRAKEARFGRQGMLYRMAAVHKDAQIQGVADYLLARGGEWDDPGMQFIWYDPTLTPAAITTLPTFHHFPDFGVVSWRSSWDADATVCLFKAGPPNGYSAQRQMAALPGWRPNAGHVHPDIGMFWLYADNEYLATDTGYSGRKRTRDHNTILVDGQGMGADNNYWVYSGFPDRNIPYAKWMGVRFTKLHLESAYAYALADWSSVYDDSLGKLQIQRHLFVNKDVMIIYDDLHGEQPHTFTSLIHADSAFQSVNPSLMKAKVGSANLLYYTLNVQECVVANAPAIIFSMVKPNEGADEQRGFQLTVTSKAATKQQHFVNVIIPTKGDRPDPQAVELVAQDESHLCVRVTWSPSNVQTYIVDLAWKQDASVGPVTW